MNSSKKMAEQSPHIMIAAGEASGDQLGGELMQALKKLRLKRASLGWW